MGSHHPIRKTVAPEIPDKLYFRIGDVARLCEVPAYVLRFWETEFPQLKPNKGGTGQRLYRKRDVEMALRIKSLLYDQGYTIPGARQVFKSEMKTDIRPEPRLSEARPRDSQVAVMTPVEGAPDAARTAALHALHAGLRDLHAILSRPLSMPAPAPRAAKVQAMRPRLPQEPAHSRQLTLDESLF